MSVFWCLGNGDANFFTNGFGFKHHLRDKIAHQVVFQNEIGGGARDGTDGVHRHIAPQLVPNVFLNLCRGTGIETCCLQIGHQLLYACAELAILFSRLAQNQALAKVMPHHTRCIE